MDNIAGYHMDFLPFNEINKVSDLIYFEGPILSHFKDKYGKDLLFYWVDNDEVSNRWVVFQIAEKDLYYYLLKKQTLRQVFESAINSVYYLVDIDERIEYDRVNLIFKENLNNQYIPSDYSYYKSEIPNLYNSKLGQYEMNFYTETALKDAIYMKANSVNNKNNKSHGYVGLLDGASFLEGLGQTFALYTENEVAKTLKIKGISDLKRINTVVKSMVKASQPDILLSKAASFGVAFRPYLLPAMHEDFFDKKWRDGLFESFKTDIIEIDKKDATEIDRIIEKYGEFEIAEICHPLIELYNNKKISIEITDSNFRSKRTIKPLNKEIVEKLSKKRPIKNEEPIERLALVKYDNISHKIKGISGATLFDQAIKTTWSTDEIKAEKKNYKLKFEIYAAYNKQSGLDIIEDTHLGIYASGENLQEAEKNYYQDFYILYERLFSTENKNLTLTEIGIKQYLEVIVKR